jgi:aminoglycoside 6'-N-acetyltransferase
VIGFRPLEPGDLPLLESWLLQEHVNRWWREPVERELAEGVDGRYAILVDGAAVGMVQTYAWAPGIAGVDLLIGEEELVGLGLGPQVLEAFAEEVVFSRPETEAIEARVEEGNRRSWRAFEKAGFRHVRDVEEDGVPHRLMRLDRR